MSAPLLSFKQRNLKQLLFWFKQIQKK